MVQQRKELIALLSIGTSFSAGVLTARNERLFSLGSGKLRGFALLQGAPYGVGGRFGSNSQHPDARVG